MRIQTFDTTLRDGTQGEAVSFSVDDKLQIVQKLDELGIDFIEGGWPGPNPKDKEFFTRARHLHLRHARLTAFGSTRFAKNSVEQDPNVRALLEAATPAVSIFGKSWDLHTKRALGVTEEENLKLISETVGHLIKHGKEVVYDAEHFFDGYINNPAFALRTLEAAKKAGASVLCLCDTNGGTLTTNQPYVGQSAFAHKGGVHVSAVLKDSATYEHIQPELVGNRQRVLLSDLSGRGNVFYKLNQHGLGDRLNDDARRELLERIKLMEYEGYELEAAEGTFELMVRKALHPGIQLFELVVFEVTTRIPANND